MQMGDTRRFWVGFSLIRGIGAVRLGKLLEAFGDIEYAWDATPQELRDAGLSASVVQAFIDARAGIDLEAEVARIASRGFNVVTWADEEYPARLQEIEGSPPVLYTWGDLLADDRWAVALVGTRRPTAYGIEVAREIATVLSLNGVTVVSGLARGIDSEAHRAALESGGRTIAVLGSGLDCIYPPEHRRLAKAVSASGAVVSDYALGTQPEARNFPPRNRIISGLSLACVVVEAGEGSGALITADFAVEQGREVFAVPGSILSRASRGTNRLIQEGASPVVSAEGILEALNLEVVARQEHASEQLPEDSTERAVYEALSADPVHVDDIRAICNLPVWQVTAALAMLELRGRARQVGGMHYVRAREQQAEYRVE